MTTPRPTEANAPRRVFLVGSPRSGTTLLQSMIAAHPAVVSFPESHFFPYILPGKRWLRKTGLVSSRAHAHFAAMATQLPGHWGPPPRFPFAREYVRRFISQLDALAVEAGKAVWVEKTPRHIQYIDEIEAMVPRAQFLHIIRQGADVVASLYQVSHAYPETWHGPLSAEACVHRWSDDVAISRRHQAKPNHFIVYYESLMSDAKRVLGRVAHFLGVEFDERMLTEHQGAARGVIAAGEHWKTSVLGPIRATSGEKLRTVFTEKQREFVLAVTCSIQVPPESECR